MAEDERPALWGGKMLSRDPWFGLSGKSRFREFRLWWHRSEKKGFGRDLMSREEDSDIYDERERTNPLEKER